LRKLIKNLLYKIGIDIRFTVINYNLALYKRLFNKESIENRRFYNVGQAAFFHPAWTIIDNFKGKLPGNYAMSHNLMSLKSLPIEDNTAELIYSSHTLEHITNKAVSFFLTDAYRILKPNGILRIIVPDIMLSYNAWKNNDTDFFFWIKDAYQDGSFSKVNLKIPLFEASLTQVFLEDFASTVSELAVVGAENRISDEEFKQLFKTMAPEEAFDYCTSRCPEELQEQLPYLHINWFNESKLKNMLRQAGFKKIYLSRWGQSNSPVMRETRLFDTTLAKVSLYMEAIK